MAYEHGAIQSIARIVGVYLFVPIALGYLYKVLKKAGVKEITVEEAERMKNIPIPRWFKYLDGFLVVSSLAAWLGLTAVIVWWFPILQKAIFAGPGTILFRGDVAAYAFIIFFSMIFIVFSAYGILTSFIPNYNIYSHAAVIKKGAGGIYNLEFSAASYAKMLIWPLAIFLPLSLLSLHNFADIAGNKLVLNSLFSVTDKAYSWNDVKEVRLRGFRVDVLGPLKYQDNTPDLLFVLSDGRIVDVWNGILNSQPGKEEILALIEMVKEKKVPFKVEKLDAEDMKYIANLTDNYRDEILDIFRSAYEIEGANVK